jgi:hypothetical protein
MALAIDWKSVIWEMVKFYREWSVKTLTTAILT